MMRIATLLAATALLAAPATAQRRCVTDAEAETLALVALPEILRETGRVCAARLPANSLIVRPGSDLIARYQAAADQAWPAAKQAIGQLSDPAVTMLLDSDYARPVIASVVVPQIVGRIALADCGTIDRLVTQLAPLPPRNTASVVVTALRYMQTDRARAGKSGVPQLPLCPATGAAR